MECANELADGRLGHPVTVGAAGLLDDLADLPAAFAEASACTHALLRLDRAGASATTADLGFAGLLLSDSASARRRRDADARPGGYPASGDSSAAIVG